jgi:hypothetical protein
MDKMQASSPIICDAGTAKVFNAVNPLAPNNL